MPMTSKDMTEQKRRNDERRNGPLLPIQTRSRGEWTCPRGHKNSDDTMICLGCLF